MYTSCVYSIYILLCFGSLSCRNRWPSGNVLVANGKKVSLRMFSIISVNSNISVAPCFEIPAHTWTLNGCLTLGFFLKRSFPCCSIQILDLSVKMTLSKVSTSWIHFWANAKRARRFGSLTAWQYLGPVLIQPIFLRAAFITLIDRRSRNLLNSKC